MQIFFRGPSHFYLQCLYVTLFSFFIYSGIFIYIFPSGAVVKNLPANAGDARDMDLITESQEDPLEKKMTTCSSILAWRISWAEECGGL